jgi:hypothetical protein
VLGLLAIMHRRAAVVVLDTGRPRHLDLPGPLAAQHHGFIIGASLGVAFFVVLLASAALVWALAARSQRHL